jgi:hypothetical protein
MDCNCSAVAEFNLTLSGGAPLDFCARTETELRANPRHSANTQTILAFLVVIKSLLIAF